MAPDDLLGDRQAEAGLPTLPLIELREQLLQILLLKTGAIIATPHFRQTPGRRRQAHRHLAAGIAQGVPQDVDPQAAQLFPVSLNR